MDSLDEANGCCLRPPRLQNAERLCRSVTQCRLFAEPQVEADADRGLATSRYYFEEHCHFIVVLHKNRIECIWYDAEGSGGLRTSADPTALFPLFQVATARVLINNRKHNQAATKTLNEWNFRAMLFLHYTHFPIRVNCLLQEHGSQFLWSCGSTSSLGWHMSLDQGLQRGANIRLHQSMMA